MTAAVQRTKHDPASVVDCPHRPGSSVCIEHGVCRHAGCHLAQTCEHGMVNTLIRLSREVAELRADRRGGGPTRACSHEECGVRPAGRKE